MVKVIHFKESIDFREHTLIIPSISVGNVGQLTVDLIITTYNLKKVATIWHPGIIPSVGRDPYQSDLEESCTACELYGSKDTNIAAIQIRSSIEFKFALNFFKSLENEIVDLKFSNIIILASTFDYELHNLQNSRFHYVSNIDDKFDHLNVLPMPLNEVGKYAAIGSGFAMKLFDLLQTTLKCTLFVKYVSEGDNRPDAVSMLNLIRRFLTILNDSHFTIKYPISWNYVFGNPPPIGIF